MSFSVRALGLLALSAAQLFNGAHAGVKSCPANSPVSCSSSSSKSSSGSCCLESPGGLLLQTQFWDTDPVTGPTDSWTIHGLWPDNCDGSYQQNCDPSRAYKNITEILQAAGKQSLLDYMKTYWQSNDESPEEFWEHEWATHGTCINTIDPSCYTNYTAGEEAADFFQQVVTLFKSLDTYQALSDANITPSTDQTYDLSDLEAATSKIHDGKTPQLSCSNGELSQIYYYFNLQGNAITGKYIPVDSPDSSNCPKSGIKYLPKSQGSSSSGRRHGG
ncbi:hypothetical protein VTN96DRAFT_7299 [Rasamsonia emersonii]|uniref:ribonuclease T2 n=1 Tax=Rasamsonia emersonii (strain ATCC 16479 / CBS 393.64 / IMI 116815) TaxID=1408163 RepID=A0A0F4YJ26_RASE3|nr:hypothetical protein T310_8179 [Rasamsonia emersonii CBS 393.64]KKA17876.1 hypothetical protein T310_8179 [Rasamsonia emersonii CBS 393.64]